MKIYLVIWVLFSLFLLWSCSIDSNKKATTHIFEKQEICAKHQDEIKKQYESSDYYVSDLFYSQKSDTCIFRISTTKLTKIHPNHILYSYPSSSELSYKDDICDGIDESCSEKQKTFNEKLKELKWE